MSETKTEEKTIPRKIISFFTDELNDWVAQLDCGHTRHVRHQPPFFDRPWLQTKEGRQQFLGQILGCRRCFNLEWPENLQQYKATPIFTQDSIPKGLTRNHQTKASVWAKIKVLSGQLQYHVEAPINQTFLLSPEQNGTVLPEIPHRIEAKGPVSLQVVFFRIN